MSDISNINEFIDKLESFSRYLSLEDQSLADALGAAYTETLQDRAANQTGPGGQWDDNQPDYARRKGNLPVGVGFTGEMLAADNLRVDASFQGRFIYFRHAGSELALLHLRWFEAGGRQLWGLDGDVTEKFHDVISEYINEKVGGR
jgi:hypothetical protein